MISLKSGHMISAEVGAFLIDRRTRRLSENTLDFYSRQLSAFAGWAAKNGIDIMEHVTPDVLRLYLLYLGDRRNAGGVHAAWRCLKVFFRWWEKEVEPADWHNPMLKVAAPKISVDPIPGLEAQDLELMLGTCDRADWYGQRNRALLSFLYDTGVRVTELCNLDMVDLDMESGRVVVRHGKGGKSRFVFAGARCRRELLRFMRKRGPTRPHDPLFPHKNGTRFDRKGVAQVIRTAAIRAGLDEVPSPHDFRRGFTIQSLRNHADPISIARMLGHSNADLVWRYARQTPDDLDDVHSDSSPLDNL